MERVVQPRFHGALGAVQRGRDVLQRGVAEKTHLHHPPLFLGQAGQHAQDVLAAVALFRGGGRTGARLVLGIRRVGQQVQRRTAARMAQ
ncbi:MAG: hypothetical protein U1F87_01585 [Kiritimatiellia bacterium]